MEQKLVTGKCGSAYSLGGAVRLWTNNTLENLKSCEYLTLRKDNKEFSLKVREITEKADKAYISFYGIDTPEEAKKVLTGAEIIVDRTKVDEFGISIV